MLYVGIDYHKRYSQVSAIDERGKRKVHCRLSNDFSTVEGFFRSLDRVPRGVPQERITFGSGVSTSGAIRNDGSENQNRRSPPRHFSLKSLLWERPVQS